MEEDGRMASLVDIDNDLTPLTWLQNINILESPPMTPPESETETPPPIDYRTNATKPPHSYSKLITMALTSNSKMTLSQIYSWIRDNFSYYQNADNSWKNSIRHNLSLNKCFVKIARAKGEPGKGGFWKLDESVLHEKRTRRTKTKRNTKPETKEPLEELVVEEFIEFQWDSVFEIELEDLMGSTISVPTSDNNILVETTTLVK